MVPPFEPLPDAPASDAGFISTGRSLPECFQAAADATLALMLENPAQLEESTRRDLQIEHECLDLLLLRFLEELVFRKDAEGLLLRARDVRVEHTDGSWRASATLAGEPIDPRRHRLGADVKAVTLHRLEVRELDGGWRAVVVLDV